MGNQLTDALVNQPGTRFFGSATCEQYNLSRPLWKQLMETNHRTEISSIRSLAEHVLNRNPEWIAASKSALSTVEYAKTANIDSVVFAVRNAFERDCLEQYDEAFSIIEAEKNQAQEPKEKKLLVQYMAEYKNFANPLQAQKNFLSARNSNSMVVEPVRRIQFQKLQCFPNGQAAYTLKYITDDRLRGNDCTLQVCSVLDSLLFSDNPVSHFAQALKDATSIGTVVQKPLYRKWTDILRGGSGRPRRTYICIKNTFCRKHRA